MLRLWLVFSQAVTVALAILFVVSTLRPDWVRLGGSNGRDTPTPQGAIPAVMPVSSAPVAISPDFSFSAAVSRAAPSVVNVYTTKRVAVPDHLTTNDAMMRKFFGLDPATPRPRLSTSLGSGVVVHGEGYVLTNYHVVEAADAIEVALADGRSFPAELVGADPDTDLAVLRLPAGTPNVPIASVASGRMLAVGDVVLAIGNPFGVGQTTTQGIVSALGRNRLGINTYENFIQTDAAINPGNSGGALVDAHGDLVGINTAIYSPPGGAMGIGFAIPIQAAEKVMAAIIKNGHVERGWLGIEPQDMTPELARSFKLTDRRGVVIAGVLRDGPAGQAGLRVGDIVRAIENVRVADTTAMLAMIAALPPGHTATLDVLRGGKSVAVEVRVGVRPRRPSH
ncbi:MAG: trypsin-like peptidase domain-containing protein [Burkholderiaceae bacterium]